METASRFEASSSSAARASAAACRTALPESGMENEPAVVPSLGTTAVSPDTMRMRSMFTSSSSAQSCASAVRMP